MSNKTNLEKEKAFELELEHLINGTEYFTAMPALVFIIAKTFVVIEKDTKLDINKQYAVFVRALSDAITRFEEPDNNESYFEGLI